MNIGVDAPNKRNVRTGEPCLLGMTLEHGEQNEYSNQKQPLPSWQVVAFETLRPPGQIPHLAQAAHMLPIVLLEAAFILRIIMVVLGKSY